MITDLQDVFNFYNNGETFRFLLHDKWTRVNLQELFERKLGNCSLTKDPT